MNHVPANNGSSVPGFGAALGYAAEQGRRTGRGAEGQLPWVSRRALAPGADGARLALPGTAAGAAREETLKLKAARTEAELALQRGIQRSDSGDDAWDDAWDDAGSEFNDDFGAEGFYGSASPPRSHTRSHSSSSPEADEEKELPVCFLPSQRGWPVSWQTTAIAGTSIAAAAAGLLYGPSGQPLYEGRVLLSAQPGFSAELAGLEFDAAIREVTGADGVTGAAANMAPPEAIAPSDTAASPVEFFTKSDTLKPVLEDLKQQDIHLTQRSLSQRLAVKPVDAHTLEMSYRGDDPETVRQVLSRVAQAYVDHQQACTEAPCQDFRYIQEQMAHTKQLIVQLTVEQEQLRQRYGNPSPMETWRSLETSLHHLERKQEDISAEIKALVPALQNTQAQMAIAPTQPLNQAPNPSENLSPNQAIAPALEVLMRSANYSSTLSQWQQVDYQIAETVFTPEADRTAAEALTQQHQELLRRLQQEVNQTVDSLILEALPNDLQAAIQFNPLGLDYVDTWLSQSHRIHLLQTRQQNLTQLAEQMNRQLNEWRAIAQRDRHLQQQIATANQNLAQYQERYSRLKPQVVQQTQVWQMVAPPDVMQAERPLANLVPRLTNAAAEAASP